MRLAGIREGDIIRADGLYARVIRTAHGQVTGQIIGVGSARVALRTFRARQITDHWRKAKIAITTAGGNDDA